MKRLLIAIALVAGLILLRAGTVVAHQAHKPAGTVHVVKSGETLWKIARVAYPSLDPREGISRIADANKLGSHPIQPGQTLLVPAA